MLVCAYSTTIVNPTHTFKQKIKTQLHYKILNKLPVKLGPSSSLVISADDLKGVELLTVSDR